MNVVKAGEQTTILLIKGESGHNYLIQRSFAKQSNAVQILLAETLAGAARLLLEHSVQFIIVALEKDDQEILEFVKNHAAIAPVLVISDLNDSALAAKAVRSGAFDYLVRSETMFLELPQIATRIMREWREMKCRQIAENLLDIKQKKLIRQHATLRKLYHQIKTFKQERDLTLDSLDDILLLLDHKCRIINLNKSAARLSGNPKSTLLGKPLCTFLDNLLAFDIAEFNGGRLEAQHVDTGCRYRVSLHDLPNQKRTVRTLVVMQVLPEWPALAGSMLSQRYTTC